MTASSLPFRSILERVKPDPEALYLGLVNPLLSSMLSKRFKINGTGKPLQIADEVSD